MAVPHAALGSCAPASSPVEIAARVYELRWIVVRSYGEMAGKWRRGWDSRIWSTRLGASMSYKSANQQRIRKCIDAEATSVMHSD